jgi:uncharacterized repeat protein (TIGR01451 family)
MLIRRSRRRARAPKLLASLVALAACLLVVPATPAFALVPPVAGQPDLSPNNPRTNALLEASTDVTDTGENDVAGVNFAWTLDRAGDICALPSDESIPAASPSTQQDSLDLSQPVQTSNCSGTDLGQTNIGRDDIVQVTVTPHDGDGSGLPMSNSVTVQNTPPSAAPFTVTPAGPKTNQTVTAETPVTDADGDLVRAAVTWTVTRGPNTCQVRQTPTGPAASGSTLGDTLDLSQTYAASGCTGASPPASMNPSDGDTIAASITPTDGTDEGAPVSDDDVVGNSAPTADAKSAEINEDTPTTFTLSGVDPDGDLLTFRISQLPTSGDLYDGAGTGGHHIAAADLTPTYTVQDGAHQVTYVPAANSNGSDSFAYVASDGPADSPSATASITVDPVNDAPAAHADSAGPIQGGGSVLIDVASNDSAGPNEPGQNLTVSSTSLVVGGTAVVEGNAVRYTADGGYSGTGGFDYQVCDDGSPSLCAAGHASVTVTAATNADVSITKTGPASVRAGQNFSYTITVDNSGPAAATGVVATDHLPPGMAFVGVTAPGSYDANTRDVTWNLGTVPAPQAPIVLTLTVTADSQQLSPYDNAATVASTSSDPAPANNQSASVHTTIVVRDIVYVSNRDGGDLDLFEAYQDGTGTVNVTASSQACDRYPAWSPDGTKIAFASSRSVSATAPCTGNMDIYVMNADGTNVTQLTNAPLLDVQPTWSPTGLQIAYSGQASSSKVNLYSTSATTLAAPVKLTKKLCGDGARGCAPDWSPNGSTLVFVRQCVAVNGCPTTAEIFTMPAAGGAMTQLTSNGVDEGSPAWSPDGTRIAMYRYDGTDNEIAMMNADGRRQAFLTADPANDIDPAWLAGGSGFVYSSTRSGNGDITLRTLASPGTPGNVSANAGADTDPDMRIP